MTPHEPEPAGSPEPSPVLAPGYTFGTVSDKISALVLVRPYNWRWFLGMGIGFALTMMLMIAIT
jgi:molybdopterin-containing oxidoreductase family membrane subunit